MFSIIKQISLFRYGNRIKELREKVNLGLEKTIKNCMKCRYSLVSKGFLLK